MERVEVWALEAKEGMVVREGVETASAGVAMEASSAFWASLASSAETDRT